jgi:hypothetical protein
MNPTWADAELRNHEGARASYTNYVYVNADDKNARFRRLTVEEMQDENAFTEWIEKRREKLETTLRVMGCLAFPSAADQKAVALAEKHLDALWQFLIVHAWPVYVRHMRNAKSIPFASVQRFYPLWFRSAHYDEYDRWAHGKWYRFWGVQNGSPEERASQSPDLYTLMKRRYRRAVEADECYEATTPLPDQDDDQDRLLYRTETVLGSGTTIRNVHRPRSGGQSYGGGAFRTLRYDPHYTCGRQRGKPWSENLPADRIAPAEQIIDWNRVPSDVACTPDWRDAHPEPWFPAVDQAFNNNALDDMGDLGDLMDLDTDAHHGGFSTQPVDRRMVRI